MLLLARSLHYIMCAIIAYYQQQNTQFIEQTMEYEVNIAEQQLQYCEFNNDCMGLNDSDIRPPQTYPQDIYEEISFDKDSCNIFEVINMKVEDDSLLYYQLIRHGFNLNNDNLMCVQMINALQAQMDVLEKVIFQTHSQPIYSYGIGFHPTSTFFNSQPSKIPIICQQDYEICLQKQRKQKQFQIKTRSTPNSIEEKSLIIQEKWEEITQGNKDQYLILRKQVDELKKVITEALSHREGKEHICLLCGSFFENGRQLGGHMSRKHPGNSIDYNKKKQLHFNKTIERERRKYFKQIKKDPLSKTNSLAKDPKLHMSDLSFAVFD